jgi:hypothetical protein
VSNDKTLHEPTGSGLMLHGRRRLVLIIAIVLAAALVATGAVITVMNDLRDGRVVDSELGATVPADDSTLNPGQGANAGGQDGNAAGQGAGAQGAAADAGNGNGNGPGFVPGQAPPVADPVAIDQPASFTERVTAEVTKIESVEGEANGPGEIAGAALRISVTLTNNSQRPVDLDKSVVALFFGADDAPATELSGPGVERFTGTLRNGESASGVYVFRVPEDQRDQIRITVSYSPTDTAVAFEGAAR